ncbi:hypothetical protein HZS_4857 [Henneguya salminicola]|nr:hypothetical protein HZS_4857 [Henneguya salminicola]
MPFIKRIFDKTLLCRNEYNYSGLCRPDSCPLSNSRYATIKEENGNCYLYIKTVERNHTPVKMWERIKLPVDYMESLKEIDKNLLYWPEFMIHKCKQRYTVIYQYLLRTKKIKLKQIKNLVTRNKKIDRREAKREEKALKGANIEKIIEKKLLEKLKDGQEINQVSEYVVDENLHKQVDINDIEDIHHVGKRKLNMIMNIEKEKRIKQRQ